MRVGLGRVFQLRVLLRFCRLGAQSTQRAHWPLILKHCRRLRAVSILRTALGLFDCCWAFDLFEAAIPRIVSNNSTTLESIEFPAFATNWPIARLSAAIKQCSNLRHFQAPYLVKEGDFDLVASFLACEQARSLTLVQPADETLLAMMASASKLQHLRVRFDESSGRVALTSLASLRTLCIDVPAEAYLLVVPHLPALLQGMTTLTELTLVCDIPGLVETKRSEPDLASLPAGLTLHRLFVDSLHVETNMSRIRQDFEVKRLYVCWRLQY
jgi:hypothetical protein